MKKHMGDLDAIFVGARPLSDLSSEECAKAIRLMGHRQRDRCYYCGRRLLYVRYGTGRASFDHVVPRNRGGRDVLSNLVAACVRCNTHKGDMEHDEFILAKGPGWPWPLAEDLRQ